MRSSSSLLDDDDDDNDDDDQDIDNNSNNNPTDTTLEPYRHLLGMSARASWRMAPPSPPWALEEAQRRILQATPHSTRPKQTKQLLVKMIEAQNKLRNQREEERKRIFLNRAPRKTETKKNQGEEPAETEVLHYGPEQAIISVKHRLYPHFSMVKRVLLESASLLPHFRPTRVLDFGTGCGSAAAAAWNVFYQSVEWVHLIDASGTMREVAETLLQDMTKIDQEEAAKQDKVLSLPRITTAAHMTTESDTSFDLCLASFTMSDLPTSGSIVAAAALMYAKLKPGGLLVILEPGTPDGFASIRMIRNMLLDCCPEENDDACRIIAPCTHSNSCPMERYYGGKRKPIPSSSSSSPESNAKDVNAEQAEKDNDDQNDESSLSEEDDGEGEGMRFGFCSFVQTMPGDTTRRRGEKLSYLVVQKKPLEDNTTQPDGGADDEWMSIDLPDHLRRRLNVRTDQPMHEHLHQEAQDFLSKFLNSDQDDLGLEFLRNPQTRRQYGRVIEAPLKRKGHVIIDCCVDGKIERHKIAKSANVIAPGFFGAARKARWGGYWTPLDATKAKDINSHK